VTFPVGKKEITQSHMEKGWWHKKKVGVFVVSSAILPFSPPPPLFFFVLGKQKVNVRAHFPWKLPSRTPTPFRALF